MKRYKRFLISAFSLVCFTSAPQTMDAYHANPQDINSSDMSSHQIEMPAPSKKKRPITLTFEKKAEKKQSFSAWLSDTRAEALKRGISKKVVDEALPHNLKPLKRAITQDKNQFHNTIDLDGYYKKMVSKTRVKNGLERLDSFEGTLLKINDKYGVAPEVIISLWGIESNFGENMGNFNSITALATLAHEGRRRALFTDELFKALKMVDQEKIPLSKLKGSWAGALGQCQFMPTSYFEYAVDFNKDGRKDIWSTKEDVLASIANYLHKSGWEKEQPWGQKIKLPKKLNSKLLGLEQQNTVKFWRDQGIKIPKIKGIDDNSPASVIQPDGPGTRAFIVYNNYLILRKWNKSNYFATSVGRLSDTLQAKKSASTIKKIPGIRIVMNKK